MKFKPVSLVVLAQHSLGGLIRDGLDLPSLNITGFEARKFDGQILVTESNYNILANIKYGCWCHFGYSDNGYVGDGFGKPVDLLDKACKTLRDNYQCATIENPSCDAFNVEYNLPPSSNAGLFSDRKNWGAYILYNSVPYFITNYASIRETYFPLPAGVSISDYGYFETHLVSESM